MKIIQKALRLTKKEDHSWKFLLWQHITTSYKTCKTKSGFQVLYEVIECCHKIGSAMLCFLVRLRTLERSSCLPTKVSHYSEILIWAILLKYIILSCHLHRYPWPSLGTPPYCSSLLADPLGYIPYPHRAAVCRFELVSLPLLGHMRGCIGEHHLWIHPCFSSSVQHVWFI